MNSTVSLSFSSNTRFLQPCNVLDVTDDSRQASCNVSSLHEGIVTSVHATDGTVLVSATGAWSWNTGPAKDGPGMHEGPATDGPGTHEGFAANGPGTHEGPATDGPGMHEGPATDGPGTHEGLAADILEHTRGLQQMVLEHMRGLQ